jgi:hypothetical protein
MHLQKEGGPLLHESKSELDPGAMCEVLQRYGVDCVVIGGVAAVLLGAPYQTFDLDNGARRRSG